jgi:D-beta-D-heptose 7-phosphate kinase/D-beta-D-heptose 1-phosphate adenosyltransferase
MNLCIPENFKVIVIGDVMIDHYTEGKFERISPEAPVPVIDVLSEHFTPGGAGNVIENLVAFGVKPIILTVIGEDEAGSELKLLFNQIGVTSEGIIVEPNRITSKKSRVMVSSHQMMRIDRETKTSISKSSEDAIIKFLEVNIIDASIIILSDYAKGVLTDSLLKRVFEISNANNIKTIVDPKGNNYEKYNGATIIKPNKKEAIEASGIAISNREELNNAANKIKQLTNCKTLIVTLSEEGMAIFDDSIHYIPTKAKKVFDVTGAGDTVIASIGMGLALGLNIVEACIFANHAAAIVISKVGSATVSVNEVLEHIKNN